MLLVFVVAVVMPVSLICWLLTILYSSFNDGSEIISPMRWMVAILAPVFIAWWGLRRKSLSTSGAIAGLLVGFILTISSFCFFSCLLTFFVSASKATHFRAKWKKKIEADFKEGGQRSWIQVLCNGGIAAQFAILYMLDNGSVERQIDFTHDYTSSWYATAVVGALACSCGDTFASEFGTVMERNSQPRLITTFAVVPKGTNGAITLMGSLFSGLGGLLVGAAFYITQLFICTESQIHNSPPQWPMLIFGLLSGLIGSCIDSFLGATLQYSGYDRTTGQVVEHSGKNIQYISGFPVFDNHSVNLLSSFVSAILMPKVAFSLWRYWG